MEKSGDDDIPTPSTSRSNSINEDEDRSSSRLSLPSVEKRVQPESSPPKDVIPDVAEQIKATIASKRDTFISSASSSSSSSSESETGFVAVNKKDLYTAGSASINAVSLLTG